MNILIAGASGFIGHELIQTLKRNNPNISFSVLGRNKLKLEKEFGSNIECISWNELPHTNAKKYEAVINLTGHNIAKNRWSPSIKKLLIDSRVNSNQQLLNWIISQQAKPHFLCANAVGIYGLQSDTDLNVLTEESQIDTVNPIDFMSEIGVRWQESLNPGKEFGIPITTMRFGVVLKKGKGMLKQLAPSFYCGLGSILGNGKQIVSWIHSEDLVNAIIFLLNHPNLTGPFNLTSPFPISQKTFAEALAKTIKRPLFLKMPARLINLLFGEMGECLLLRGQRVYPKRLKDEGFTFLYPTIDEALAHEFC